MAKPSTVPLIVCTPAPAPLELRDLGNEICYHCMRQQYAFTRRFGALGRFCRWCGMRQPTSWRG